MQESSGEPSIQAVAPVQADQETFYTSDASQYAEIHDETITWTASEFIAHHKNVQWYLMLSGFAVVVIAIVFLLTHSILSSVVVALMTVALGMYASRQPRELPYQLTADSVNIGDKEYPLSSFRSFSVVPEGAFLSVIFMPLKRFASMTTIYFSPTDQDRIIDLLSSVLPFEEHRHDPIERLMRKIRF